jgi:DNA-binding NarL/FixJ family response regulator
MNKTRIMIVDDHPLLRKGLNQLISQEPDLQVCCEASDREEAICKIEVAPPDLIIMDISLPDSNVSGIELIKQVHSLYPQTVVLVLSVHEESVFAERAIRAGAGGYLMKQEPPEAVIAGIRRVMRGELVLSESMAQAILRRCLSDNEGGGGTTVSKLSNREYEVLRLVGEGLQPQQISERLRISTKTVETHRFNIRKKLRLASASELIQFAIRHVHNQEVY